MGRLALPRRLGIMGGMGPMATVDLYRKVVELTPARCDQEHIPIVIDNFPQIEDRTAYLLKHGKSPFNKMLESANRLKQAGAEAILIACNTAHYFADQIQQQADIDIISMIDATVEALRDRNNKGEQLKKIAVLATDGTVKSGLYQKKLAASGFAVVPIDERHQKLVMDCIYSGAKTGKIEPYQEIFQGVVDDINADAYIAACTEIPLFMPKLNNQHKMVDATLVLAKKAVEFALYDQKTA